VLENIYSKERIKSEIIERVKENSITNNNNITVNVYGKTEDINAITRAVKNGITNAGQKNTRQLMGGY
jgi:uncharacterized pyridoxal phosphate-containing UPF0001 family protein